MATLRPCRSPCVHSWPRVATSGHIGVHFWPLMAAHGHIVAISWPLIVAGDRSWPLWPPFSLQKSGPLAVTVATFHGHSWPVLVAAQGRFGTTRDHWRPRVAQMSGHGPLRATKGRSWPKNMALEWPPWPLMSTNGHFFWPSWPLEGHFTTLAFFLALYLYGHWWS